MVESSCVLMRCDSWFFFFKQKTAYEMRISDWSSDVCSSDLVKSGQGVCAIGTQKDRIESQRRSSGRLGVTPSRIERAIGVGNQRGRAGEGARKPRFRALLPKER